MKWLFISLVILYAGCNSQELMSVNLSHLEKYKFSEKHISVILLKSFIVNHQCISAKDEYYANVFMCKTTYKDDTILVFTICQRSPDFLKSNYRGERDIIIDSSNVVKRYPQKVITNIDENILKKKYKIVVGNLTDLLY